MAEAPVGLPSVLATASVFTALVRLWAAYFGGGEDVITTAVATTTDPVRSVRLGTNSAYLVLAALVALAVGSELAIAHPTGHGCVTLALLLFGGPALHLATTAWFFGTTAGGRMERAPPSPPPAWPPSGCPHLPPSPSSTSPSSPPPPSSPAPTGN